MGLDIYLEHNTSGHTIDELEEAAEAWETITSDIWQAKDAEWLAKDHEYRTDKSKDSMRHDMYEAYVNAKADAWAEFNTTSKYAGWLRDQGEDMFDTVCLPSAMYPEHLFKIGYFRSSYNGGGINRILKSYGVEDLYGIIYGPDDHSEYRYKPNWQAVRLRAEQAISDLDAAHTEYRAVEVIHGLETGRDINPLATFIQTKERNDANPSPFGGAFTNGEGTYSLDEPMKVVAVIHHKGAWNDHPAVTLIVQEPLHISYRQSLEIVVETCDYVLSQPDPENYLFTVSG